MLLFFFAEYPAACCGDEGERRTATKPTSDCALKGEAELVFGFEAISLLRYPVASHRELRSIHPLYFSFIDSFFHNFLK
ncbi:MAG: hypothetical protein Q8O30_06430 [Candidatus Omnitrophota bacterium]|nr:hypothetical protein [Candidatus Omnitrophota bacterium]